MTRRAWLAAAAALASAVTLGCGANEAQPDAEPATSPGPSTAETEPGESAPSAAKDRDDRHVGGVGHWSILAASATDALDTPGPDGRTPEFVDAPLARGDDLEVSLIAARGRIPAPARAADEVLIVVQGPFADDRPCGVLHVTGRPHELSPGTVALLPAGARGALEPARGGKPLLAIVARTLRRPAPGAPAGEPWVADLAALDPQLKPEPGTTPEIREVATLGRRIGLYVLALSTNVLEARTDPSTPLQARVATRVTPGVLSPRVHPGHDEALLFLTGEGNLALDRTSHRVQAGSLVLIPAGVEFYLTNDAPRPGTRALLISAPATAGADVQER